MVLGMEAISSCTSFSTVDILNVPHCLPVFYCLFVLGEVVSVPFRGFFSAMGSSIVFGVLLSLYILG